MKKFRLLEIGPYPPPATGWSVRLKYVKEAFQNAGHDCQVLNLGRSRKEKSKDYIDVQGGFDYLKKLFSLRLKGYHFHKHMNAQAVKGPLLTLIALIVSMLTFEKAALTFHGGIEQLYFPKRNAGKMYFVVYLNFLFAKIIICNNDQIKKEIFEYGPFIDPHKIRPIQAFSIQYLQYEAVNLGEKTENFFATKKQMISCYIVLRNGFFIETLLGCLECLSPDIGMVLVGIREVEDSEIFDQYQKLLEYQNKNQILMIENMDRNEFLSLLKRSDLCLRTPISDGVSSTVLEALYLGTPVVASENNRRPPGVITYEAENPQDLTVTIHESLANLANLNRNLPQPEIIDTVAEEMQSLIDVYSS